MLLIDTPVKTVVIRKTLTDKYRSHDLLVVNNDTGRVLSIDARNECAGEGYFKYTLDMSGEPYGEYTYYIAGSDWRWTLTTTGPDTGSWYYVINDVYLGAAASDIYISQGTQLGISAGSDEQFPVHIVQCGLLRYYNAG